MAVALVIVTHYAPGDSVLRRLGIDYAVIGVTVFFVLSGFLITKLLIEKYFAGSSFIRGFAAFLTARSLRIAPLAFFAVGFVECLSDVPLPAGFLVQHLFFVSNIHTALTGEFFVHLGHFWSLAVEMQFYLIFPIFIFVFKRNWFIFIAISMMILAYLNVFIERSAIFTAYGFLLPAQVPAFLWGSVLYWLATTKFFGAAVRLLLFAGVVLYLGPGIGNALMPGVFLASYSGANSMIPFVSLANVFAAGLVGVTMLPGTFLNRALSCQPWVHLGKISYGLYVWHPILWLAWARTRDLGGGVMYGLLDYVPLWAVLVVGTFLFAEMSWWLFEHRLNALGHRWSRALLRAPVRVDLPKIEPAPAERAAAPV